MVSVRGYYDTQAHEPSRHHIITIQQPQRHAQSGLVTHRQTDRHVHFVPGHYLIHLWVTNECIEDLLWKMSIECYQRGMCGLESIPGRL